MTTRLILVSLFLSALTFALLPLRPAVAVTAAAAKSYGLRIQHAQLSKMKLEGRKQAIELNLTLTNAGPHGLYDIRLFLIRPDTRIAVEEPARLRILPAGETAAVSWTFELPESISDIALRNVTFRIEAVDQSSQEIVSFNQQSREAR